MNQRIKVHTELLETLALWQRQNQSGRRACIWRRRTVWLSQIIQKLGLHLEVTAPLFWGERMRVVTGETISKCLLTFGYTEIAITALMLRLLGVGQTMVDVGTHFGYEALLGCHLVGTEGRIICFEPSPTAFALARKNLSRFLQVDLRQEAVADQCGKLRLQNRPIWDSALNSLSTEQNEIDSIDVSVTTLDKVLAKRVRPVDFLKCDAEGFEIAVLKGAHNLLREDAPVLVLEADMPIDGKSSPRARHLANHLNAYNYRAFSFDFDGCFRFGPLDSFPVYHANVAFVPDSRPDLLSRISGA